jgi:uncharacterized membrane protein
MSTQTIDYDALAKKYGATSSTAPQATPQSQSAPQGAPQAASVDYDALAQKYGATSSQAPEQPGLIERAGNFLTKVHEQGPVEVGKGLIKGAGDTLLGVSELAQKAQPGAALAKLVSPAARENQKHFEQFSGDAHATLETKNEAQEAGKGLEFVAEMFLGDGAFKALSSLEKVKQLHKAAQMIEKYPTIAKILQRSITAGASAGTVETVKTQDLEKGAEAALIGGATGGLFEGGSAAGKAAFNLGKNTTKKIVSSVWDSVSGKALQKDIEVGLRGSLEAAAKDAGVAVQSSGAQPAARNVARSVAERVEEKSKALFKPIDEATNGKLTNVQNKIKNVQRELRMKAGTDATVEERLLEQQAALASELDDLLEMAKREGVPVELVDAAKAAYKQSMALRDLDVAIKASTEGFANAKAEVIDPKKLAPRLRKLYDEEGGNRLATALGDEQAEALISKVYKAVTALEKHGGKVKAAKAVAPYGIGAAAGVLGGYGLKALAGDD